MDSLVQDCFLNKLLFPKFLFSSVTWLLSAKEGDKRSPRNESHGIGDNRGANVLCHGDRTRTPQQWWLEKGLPEEESARVGDLALGAAEQMGVATPVGSAVTVE